MSYTNIRSWGCICLSGTWDAYCYIAPGDAYAYLAHVDAYCYIAPGDTYAYLAHVDAYAHLAHVDACAYLADIEQSVQSATIVLILIVNYDITFNIQLSFTIWKSRIVPLLSIRSLTLMSTLYNLRNVHFQDIKLFVSSSS